MGLLTRYLDNRREDQKAAETKTLLDRLYGSVGDTMATSYSAQMQPQTETYDANTGQTHITGGEMMQGQGTPQGMEGGSGVLGNQLTPQQFNAQRQAGLAGIWGADGLMQSLGVTGMQNAGAMQRQMAPSFTNQQTAQHQAMGYLQKESDRGYQMRAQYAPSIEMSARTLDLLSNGDGSIIYDPKAGVAHQQAVQSLAKAILPSEAVMTDDRGNIISARGAPGYLARALAQSRGGSLDETTFYQVVEALQHNAEATQNAYRAERDKIAGRVRKLNGGDDWLPAPLSPIQNYKIGGRAQTVAPGLVPIN